MLTMRHANLLIDLPIFGSAYLVAGCFVVLLREMMHDETVLQRRPSLSNVITAVAWGSLTCRQKS